MTTAISSAVSAGAGGLSGKIALSDGAAVRVGKALRRSRTVAILLKYSARAAGVAIALGSVGIEA